MSIRDTPTICKLTVQWQATDVWDTKDINLKYNADREKRFYRGRSAENWGLYEEKLKVSIRNPQLLIQILLCRHDKMVTIETSANTYRLPVWTLTMTMALFVAPT